MNRLNRGYQWKNDYLKFVTFNEAVLWRTKELSLTPEIANKILDKKLDNIYFVDKERNQKLKISVADFFEKSVLIQRNQEPQYYIKLTNFVSEPWDLTKTSRDIKLD